MNERYKHVIEQQQRERKRKKDYKPNSWFKLL